jgi:NAD(P)-dependent dehydrogenase (short-subunit alcohol dehydrogenase family)
MPGLSINARAVFFSMQHVIRQMLKQEQKPSGSRGKIVNISSINGVTAGWHVSTYTGSKLVDFLSIYATADVDGSPYYKQFFDAHRHAVVGLSKCAAVDYAKEGININVVAPVGKYRPSYSPLREKVFMKFRYC